ncbi:Hypothetical protein A7982_11088 [Minicystis rosea]|nr:Hypothetical protein A7982_11088 [Minicystis rosea]
MNDPVATALASDDPDAALEALERAPGTSPEVVARACIAHAHHLLAITPSPLEVRDRALRKAARAVRIVEESKLSEDLSLAALRAHVDAQRALPGRLESALEKGLVLIAKLERAATDTRAERAERWLDRGRMMVPWANDDERTHWSRAEGATSEAALRRALALYEDLGDWDGVGECVVALVQLLVSCRASVALDELAGALPRVIASDLRRRAEGWTIIEDVPRALRRLADAIEVRRDDAKPVASEPERALCAGDRVTHAKLGAGTVLAVADDKAEVRFDDGSTRRLLCRVLVRVP